MEIHSVKLVKIESNQQNLRDDEIPGTALSLPEVGKIFCLLAEPRDLDPGIVGYRQITTSRIKEVDWIYENICEFKTMNSTYHLEVFRND